MYSSENFCKHKIHRNVCQLSVKKGKKEITNKQFERFLSCDFGTYSTYQLILISLFLSLHYRKGIVCEPIKYV